MPGSSLWLLPPQSHPLNTTLQNLITSIPSANFKPIAVDNHPFANFIPHITVTSDIPSEPDNSQQWLDNLSLPYSTGDLSVVLQDVEAGSAFFRKLTVRVEKNEGFRELGAACREQGTGCSREEAGRWAEGVYGPHLSLGYSDIPTPSVEQALPSIEQHIHQSQGENPGCKTAKGGWLVLVPTYKAVKDWKPVAWRELAGLRWEWRT